MHLFGPELKFNLEIFAYDIFAANLIGALQDLGHTDHFKGEL